MDGIQWVERLGGWGAVVLCIWWFMRRMDKLLDGYCKALESFARLEVSAKEAHKAVIENQKEILRILERIHRELKT